MQQSHNGKAKRLKKCGNHYYTRNGSRTVPQVRPCVASVVMRIAVPG
jgi:hypothetical protein